MLQELIYNKLQLAELLLGVYPRGQAAAHINIDRKLAPHVTCISPHIEQLL